MQLELHQDEIAVSLEAIDPRVQETLTERGEDPGRLLDEPRTRHGRCRMPAEVSLHTKIPVGRSLEHAVTEFAVEEHERPLPTRRDFRTKWLDEEVLLENLSGEPLLALVGRGARRPPGAS